jgi:hypothetical protein
VVVGKLSIDELIVAIEQVDDISLRAVYAAIAGDGCPAAFCISENLVLRAKI